MNCALKQYSSKRWFSQKPLIAVFFSFLLISLLVFSGFYLTGPPAASALGTESQTAKASVDMPRSFADLTEKLGPTVVNIKSTKIEKVRGFRGPNAREAPFGDPFRHFFRQLPQRPDQYPTRGAGSGVIISSDGYILTNNHVVEGAKELAVTLSDKKEYKAQIVGRDPKTDLAVVKIKTDDELPSATMGDSEHLRVGDWVIAIGNPFGLSHTVTSGIVSAKGRIIGAGPYDDFIQTDASINPGNSGGPLFNLKGELVGINTAIIPQGQGIGFAIPVNTAKPLIPQLVDNGEVSRGYLGVNIQDITPQLAKALKIDDHKGALVADVVSGSPAEKAGIKRGDVIVAYNDKAVQESHDLPTMVAATPEGEKATVTLLRNGKEHKLSVKAGELPSDDEPMIEASQHSTQEKWGLMLENIDPRAVDRFGRKVDHGVVVAGVKPGSPAGLAGIRRGDIISEVNHKPVTSVKEVNRQIKEADDGDALLLLVNRGRGSFFVGLTG